MTLAKFSVLSIVRGQLSSMRNYGTARINRREVLFLFVLPLVVPVVQLCTQVLPLSKDVVATVVSAASIFAGLLLNLLVLLYSFVSAADNPDVTERDATTETTLVEQTFNNVSFAIVVSVVLVAASLVTLAQHAALVAPAVFCVYYFGAMLMLLVLQILKRVHALMQFRIEVKGKAVAHRRLPRQVD